MPGTTPQIFDVLQMRVICVSSNQVGMNIFHFQVLTVGGGGLTLQEIAATLDINFAAVWKPLLCNTATYNGLGVTNITSPRTVEFNATAGSGVGTGGVGLLPTQIRGLVSFYGSQAGPKHRGRLYVPFPSTVADSTTGFPSGAYQTALTTLRADLLAVNVLTIGGRTTGLSLVIPNKPYGGPLVTPVVRSTTSAKWATQRRSGQFGRANTAPF